ncbi:GDSL-type esterase/lipase family protein [Prosthecobacter sp.]|uniref:GDSL-type esterase/lipase family protein n=1 Tax=Prosthecobacter sp. TaxID=1965333 RepID=UPI003784E279
MNRRLFTTLLLALAVLHLPHESQAADPVRVACVGDSITQGVGIQNPQKDGYPAKLQEILGANWTVQNFGVGGRTMLRKADPFDHRPALASSPDIVIIALGTNDSKTGIWASHKGEFVADYVAMIKEFQALPSHPKVWACLPVPAFPGNWGITEDVIRKEVIPAIQEAAKITGISVIDLHTPLLGNKPWFPDTVHPNEAGATRIAELVGAMIAK